MSTLIAARSSLARHLSRDFARQRAAAGDSIYPTPAIYSLNGWLHKEWTHLVSDPPAGLPVLLSPRQELLLWERIIRESPVAANIVDVPAAAELARQAHALVHSWRMPVSGPAYSLTEDSAAFEQWQDRFRKECGRQRWAPPAALADLLTPYLETKPELVLAGFYDATPQQRELFGNFRHRLLARPEVESSRIQSVRFSDSAEEFGEAAEWARGIVDADPDASVAIVIADFSMKSAVAGRSLDRRIPGRWRSSQGPPLASEPLAASALNLMEFLQPLVSIATAGAVLLSPFIRASDSELLARAGQDARLRDTGGSSVGLLDIARADSCPWFHRMTAAWLDHSRALPQRQHPSDWVRDFHTLLSAYYWPGDRNLSAREHATFEMWRDALAEFASLDRIAGPMTAREAVAAMREIAAGLTLEDPSSAYAPVEILPPHEAEGRLFSHVWLSGFHDQAWPPAASPQPFLPLALQFDCGLPQASSRLILDRTRLITEGLLVSAPKIVIAQCEYEEDRKLRPSRLLPRVPAEKPAGKRATVAQVEMESLVDEQGPPLPFGETHSGGVSIFKWQAACPFHAFAEYRLHARPLEEPALGFDSRDRGNVLHTALQYCWEELQSSSALTDPATAAALDDLIYRSVDRALASKWPGVAAFDRQLKEVERERLAELIRHWMTTERQRSLPFKILHVEHRREFEIAGLRVRVRADRVDQLPDKSVVLIDYKSSERKARLWEGDRPEEPQLPLYAVASEERVAAVAFAVVEPGDCKFEGIADRPGFFGRRTKAKEVPIPEWRDVLSNLAAAYLSGAARVDPTYEACRSCQLQRLCRIHEIKAGGDDE